EVVIVLIAKVNEHLVEERIALAINLNEFLLAVGVVGVIGDGTLQDNARPRYRGIDAHFREIRDVLQKVQRNLQPVGQRVVTLEAVHAVARLAAPSTVSPSVITKTGLDIHRYICSAWRGVLGSHLRRLRR